MPQSPDVVNDNIVTYEKSTLTAFLVPVDYVLAPPIFYSEHAGFPHLSH
jgi:hypothetical protein